LQAEEDSPGNMSVLKGEAARLMKNSRGAVASTRTVKRGRKVLTTDKIGIQRGGLEEDDNGVAIGTSTPNSNLQLPPPLRNSQVCPQ